MKLYASMHPHHRSLTHRMSPVAKYRDIIYSVPSVACLWPPSWRVTLLSITFWPDISYSGQCEKSHWVEMEGFCNLTEHNCDPSARNYVYFKNNVISHWVSAAVQHKSIVGRSMITSLADYFDKHIRGCAITYIS